MKLYIKTINQQKYEIDIDDSISVLECKNIINNTHKLGDPDLVKLILNGKILENDNLLNS